MATDKLALIRGIYADALECFGIVDERLDKHWDWLAEWTLTLRSQED
jgi:hypothetical protein